VTLISKSEISYYTVCNPLILKREKKKELYNQLLY
jgi:hypothetical protein